MAQPLVTPALRRRFAELGAQDGGDAAQQIVVAHFFPPGTAWHWWALSFDEHGVPMLFCLVHGWEIELGYVALAELETVRSPLGVGVERDAAWQECTLAELRRRLVQPAGYWRRGEDWWTAEEAEDGLVPGDAAWVPLEREGER